MQVKNYHTLANKSQVPINFKNVPAFTSLEIIQPKFVNRGIDSAFDFLERWGVPKRYVDAILESEALKKAAKKYNVKVERELYFGELLVKRGSGKMGFEKYSEMRLHFTISKNETKNKIIKLLNKLNKVPLSEPPKCILWLNNLESSSTLEKVKKLNTKVFDDFYKNKKDRTILINKYY